MMKKCITKVLFGFLIFLFVFFRWNLNAEAKRDIIIVIDPGHGGTNLGAQYNNVTEKEATMKVAAAMKEELEKYEGVVVYLTRTNDADLELVERAEFANEVNADILLSLHFNMSEMHDLKGSEMWVSSKSWLKAEATRFAEIELMLLADLGIETRGCFTRYNSQGTDYYGVIRESAIYNIPAVIVEHCYLDRPEEEQFYDTDAALDRLGRIDATAIAMAYGLSSEELGVDYSGHRISNTELPEFVIKEDTTAPDRVDLDIISFNQSINELYLNLKVDDAESTMVYYQYSFDGGKTFSEPVLFGAEHEAFFSTDAYPSDNNLFMVRAYNAYGLYADSEIYDLNQLYFHTTESSREDSDVAGIIDELSMEVESAMAELPPEVQSAAKYVLIFGFGSGLIFIICLIFHQFKKRNLFKQINAKGA